MNASSKRKIDSEEAEGDQLGTKEKKGFRFSSKKPKEGKCYWSNKESVNGGYWWMWNWDLFFFFTLPLLISNYF